MIINLIVLILSEIAFSNSYCEEGINHCLKCNPITKLCYKCDLDIFIPDEIDGCKPLKQCIIGNNYCLECQEEGNLCQKCATDYFPDEFGGCSYTDNCEISYKGNCLKCKDSYILIGKGNNFNDGIKICKSLNLGDLENCEKFNSENGLCEECKPGYYLNSGDYKCSLVENCFESSFEICKKCKIGYMINKKENKCIIQVENFEHCLQTLDEKVCDICEDNYYFDNEGLCVDTNYCDKRENSNKCGQCISGYYLSEDKMSCVSTENCKEGNKEIGICEICSDKYYLDYKDGKCKSNEEENEFIFCKKAENVKCVECLNGYFLGEDNKCSNAQNCSESNNGICSTCTDNYFLTNDNECTNVEHCISIESERCKECEENYYYNFKTNKCLIAEGKFENCKYSVIGCIICVDNYYLNQTDSICYTNLEDNDFYKCTLTDKYGKACIACMRGYKLDALTDKCIEQ